MWFETTSPFPTIYLFILTNIIDDRVWFLLKNETNSFLDFDPLKFMCTT